MPTVEDHKEAAKAALRRYAQPDTEPKLDDTELNSILDSVQRASFWLPSTVQVYGAVVLPATQNGHRYRCTRGGATAATEPTWPTRNGAVITDGEVEWTEAGADFENVFDIRAAAHEAWKIKEAKATVLFDRDRQLYSQIASQCREMAQSFEPIKFA
jgi:hypothetical protein